MHQFEVVGDVMGDVMGDDDFEYVGAARARGRKPALVRVRKPDWRERQLAPGVIAPDEGLVPMPLTNLGGADVFTSTLQAITFQGQLQKPFRGERLLVIVTRTGTTATGRLRGQMFIGTDLQQATIQGFDLEAVGAVNGFGVRLTMKPAQPGVVVQIPTVLSTALTTTDTIAVSITLLGRILQ